MNQTMRWLMLVALTATAFGCAGPQTTPNEPPASDVVARIGDRAFTLDDVDSKARELNVKPFQALYDARKQALEVLVTDHLLETEAQTRGVTRDALLEQEVTRKMVRPTTEQVQAFYEQNKAGMRGRSLEEMSSRISNQLATQGRQQLRQDLISSLKTKNPVSVMLEPPRVPVTIAENDPTKGPAGAPVQILEFSDFQ